MSRIAIKGLVVVFDLLFIFCSLTLTLMSSSNNALLANLNMYMKVIKTIMTVVYNQGDLVLGF